MLENVVKRTKITGELLRMCNDLMVNSIKINSELAGETIAVISYS